MSSFAPCVIAPRAVPPDPSKHVHYTRGMVLGVDDFTQEFAYLSGRDQWLARDLLGYGTVCGLQVTVDVTDRGPRVAVTPGTAVSPQGQMMHVTPAQCAFLNDWLAMHHQAVLDHLGSPPGNMVTLYVVLSYRACPTDQVPIPGEPCRSEDDMMAPSRLKDDFQLELRFAPPDQPEEDALRDFVAWLSQIDISSGPSTVTLDEFTAIVRQAALPLSSPAGSPPDFMYGSPPMSLHLDTADACPYLRAAFRLWVTELRPQWRPRFWEKWYGCASDSSAQDESDAEEWVLLAALRVPLTVDGQVAAGGTVVVDEERRPYLVHLRMLQEWVLCGRHGQAMGVGTARTFATLFVTGPQTIRAWIHYPLLLNMLAGDVIVEVNDAPVGSPPQLTAVSQPFPGVNVFDLHLDVPLADDSRVTVRFDASSITEGTSPARSLAAALDEIDYAYLDRQGHALLAYLAVDFPALDDLVDVNTPAPSDGQVLTRQGGQWVAAPPAGGVTDHGVLTGLEDDDHPQYLLVDPTTRALIADLDGGTNRITNLSPGANPGDAVIFQQAIKIGDTAGGDLTGTYPDPTVAGLQGRPVSIAAPNPNEVLTWSGAAWEPRPVPPLLPFVHITRLDNNIFELWFNIDAPENNFEIQSLTTDHFVVLEETNAAPFLAPINVRDIVRIVRNLFLVTLERESDLLRFRFVLSRIQVTDGPTVQLMSEYIVASGIKFMGHDGRDTVTAFVRGSRG